MKGIFRVRPVRKALLAFLGGGVALAVSGVAGVSWLAATSQPAMAQFVPFPNIVIKVPGRGGGHGGGGTKRKCPSKRWQVMTISNRMIASNNKGVAVTFDDKGDIVIKITAKSPLPVKPADGIVPLKLNFGRHGKHEVKGRLDGESNLIVIDGMQAVMLANLLKKARYIKITFVNNDFCTGLRGSTNAIEQVEAAAAFWKANKKDEIDERREARAKAEHAERPERLGQTQREAADKMAGIRPKPHLKKDQARNKPSVNIQYFVPGSEATGEMWVDWDVDENKGPILRLNFIDIKRQYDVKAEVISLSLKPVKEKCDTDISKAPKEQVSPACRLVRGLLVAEAWGRKAQQKGLRRQFSKRVLFADGNGKSTVSTAVNFILYENGAVAAQIEHRRHGFPRRFNFTMANALELARYVEDIRQDAAKNIVASSLSDEELDKLFQAPDQ